MEYIRKATPDDKKSQMLQAKRIFIDAYGKPVSRGANPSNILPK